MRLTQRLNAYQVQYSTQSFDANKDEVSGKNALVVARSIAEVESIALLEIPDLQYIHSITFMTTVTNTNLTINDTSIPIERINM